ncbi:MAG: DUF4097 family beta strand repeat-containing protein [Leeuwenhoekiella sp.]
MKRIVYVICAYLLSIGLSVYGQKVIEKEFDATGIEGLSVTSDQNFKIYVRTSTTKEIILKSSIDGETFETAFINTELQDNMLVIKSGRSPYFEDIDDKLAAHKVLSVTLSITIPENLEFWVDSSLAAVKATGDFKYINLNLGRGDCNFYDFRGSGKINTRSGNINIETTSSSVEATSRHGIVNLANDPNGSFHLELKSLTGSITVIQNQ